MKRIRKDKLQVASLWIAPPGDFIEATFALPAVRALIAHVGATGTRIITAEEMAGFWTDLTGAEVISHPSGANAKIISRSLDGEVAEAAFTWGEGPAATAFARVGVARRIGLPAKAVVKSLTEPIEIIVKPGPIAHRVEHYLVPVEELGVDARQKSHFATAEPARDGELLIAPWSELGPAYQWPVERMAEAVAEVVEGSSRVCKIVTLPGGETVAEEVVAALANGGIVTKAFVFAAESAEASEAVRSARALIGLDGALPHLAAAFGVPTAVVFGPGEPRWRRPLGRIHRIVREHVACSPCFATKCPLDGRCLEEVGVASVVAAAGEILNRE